MKSTRDKVFPASPMVSASAFCLTFLVWVTSHAHKLGALGIHTGNLLDSLLVLSFLSCSRRGQAERCLQRPVDKPARMHGREVSKGADFWGECRQIWFQNAILRNAPLHGCQGSYLNHTRRESCPQATETNAWLVRRASVDVSHFCE